jgi:hypothetical protein
MELKIHQMIKISILKVPQLSLHLLLPQTFSTDLAILDFALELRALGKEKEE